MQLAVLCLQLLHARAALETLLQAGGSQKMRACFPSSLFGDESQLKEDE